MKIKPKVLVIVGPTASGKTSLSITLAKKFNGEVVSADSRQVYTGLDIGTGKVTTEEMDGVPHHLIDVVQPSEKYTITEYVRDARNAIEDITKRGKLPIVVGGTFFYIDALLGKIVAPEVPPNEELREKLEELSTDELLEILKKKDPDRAHVIDTQNPRRLIRAIEIAEALGKVPPLKSEELYDTLTLGIDISKEKLKEYIHDRLLRRIHEGMIDEVVSLEEEGLSYERLAELGIEYRYIAEYLQGKMTDAELISVLETKIWQYAKRQMTWLKRDPEIVWIKAGNVESVITLITKFRA